MPWLSLQRKASRLLQDHDYVLYGGSRGPGKSYWLRWQTIALLVEWAEVYKIQGITGGLFCETFPALKDRQLSKIAKEVPSHVGVLKDSKAHGLALHLAPTLGGGILRLGNLDDPSKYQSAEFAVIAVDELTKNKFDTFDELRGSMRYPGIPKPKFLGATNPGNIGHLWVKAIFVDRDFSGHPQLDKIKDKFAFVRALPGDNPFLTDEYYENILGTLNTQLEKAWRYGSWTAFAGQVFKEWNPTEHVCEPFNIPEHWIKKRGIDAGYSAPGCCLWGATDPHTGRLYIYREAYGPSITDQDMAKTIAKYSENEVYQVSFADPSMWQTKNMRGVISSPADEYTSHGVIIMPGDNKRIGGKNKVHQILAPMKDGDPGMVVFETCRNLIRTLPALVYSKKAGQLEDVDTDGEDHAYDALRYMLSNLAPSGRRDHNGGAPPKTPDTIAWERQANRLADAFG